MTLSAQKDINRARGVPLSIWNLHQLSSIEPTFCRASVSEPRAPINAFPMSDQFTNIFLLWEEEMYFASNSTLWWNPIECVSTLG